MNNNNLIKKDFEDFFAPINKASNESNKSFDSWNYKSIKKIKTTTQFSDTQIPFLQEFNITLEKQEQQIEILKEESRQSKEESMQDIQSKKEEENELEEESVVEEESESEEENKLEEENEEVAFSNTYIEHSQITRGLSEGNNLNIIENGNQQKLLLSMSLEEQGEIKSGTNLLEYMLPEGKEELLSTQSANF